MLDFIGGLLDNPGRAVGIRPEQIAPEDKWAYRGMILSALGQSLQGGPTFYEGLSGIREGMDKRDELELKRQRELAALQAQQEIAQILGGGAPIAPPGMTQAQANAASLAAPVSQAGAPGPTVARANMAAGMTAPPAVAGNPNASRANALRAAAMRIAASSPENAKRYMDMADALDPREEYSTDPKTFTSPSGQPVVAVFSKSGGMKVLQVQPLPNRKYQDTGSEILVIDDVSGRVLERLPKSMSPAEAANLRVAQGQLGVAQGNLAVNRERLAREGTAEGVDADGNVIVYNRNNPAAGGTVVPGVRPTASAGADKPTEGQLGAAGYLLRMREAEKLMQGPGQTKDGQPLMGADGKPVSLEASGRTGYFTSAVRSTPLVGNVAATAMSGVNAQRLRQAQEDWVRAKLRKESGAVIGDEEMAREITTYFPQPGETDPAIIAQKARARKIAEQAMEIAAGAGAKRLPASIPPVPQSAVAAEIARRAAGRGGN